MLTSMRFEQDEGKESGRLAVYLRKSWTCRVPLGYIDYENAEEREELRKIMVVGHPDVEIIGPEVTIGNFVDLYFKP
ncbi:MAG: hypothetical protein ISF22_02485 [Methanomassiliicoccus sp.]|nr:hypothetical protein [Methanomassiliicoccus sp.]